jgi:predicted nucleic acid-binding protein
MIVVDSAVWIDHYHHGIDQLDELMAFKAALMHPFVLGEIALGTLRNRADFLDNAADLPLPPVAEPLEVLNLIASAALHGSGIGYVDAHLIAATMLIPNGALWTTDRRLGTVAKQIGIAF